MEGLRADRARSRHRLDLAMLALLFDL